VTTRYVPHSPADVEEMLAAVGATSVDDLFAEIPEEVRRREPLALPAGLSESEVVAELCRLADRDVPATQLVSFLGAGVYDHFVPAVVVQQPNFFGALEDVAAAAELAHAAGALLVVVADPVSLGLLEAPGRLGADIVVGEAQALGNAMSFGGPGVGYMAVSAKLMRRIPGRLVGETVDLEGRRGYVLTLQTREQHIRREKATSNICSNHALNALATLVYLSWLGKEGLPDLGLHCARKAAYLRERLLALPGVTAFTGGPVFREFAVRLPKPAAAVVEALVPEGFLAGVPAGRFAGLFVGDLLDDVLLVAVTERRTRAELDAFADALGRLLASEEVDRG
jgi:glycine dehydrogenase subunit 1